MLVRVCLHAGLLSRGKDQELMSGFDLFTPYLDQI